MIKRRMLKNGIILAAAGFGCLAGYGRAQTRPGGEYQAEDVSAVQIQADTWNILMDVSSDDKIRVSFEGNVPKGDTRPEVQIQEGILQVVQKGGKETLGDKIAFGKKGEITVYLPEKHKFPIAIQNGSGDMKINGVNAADFQLENDSGYGVFSDFTTEQAQVTSRSGDITWKGGETAHISMNMESGYGVVKETVFHQASLAAGSGEINISGAAPDTDIQIQTGSGDISLSYEPEPENLEFDLSSGSKDLSVGFPGAAYTKETEAQRKGVMGDGKYRLEIASGSGTIVVK